MQELYWKNLTQIFYAHVNITPKRTIAKHNIINITILILNIVALATAGIISLERYILVNKQVLKSVNSIEIEFIENNESENNNSISGIALGKDIKSQGTYWKIIL